MNKKFILIIISTIYFSCKNDRKISFCGFERYPWSEKHLEQSILTIDSLVSNRLIDSKKEILFYDTLLTISRAFNLTEAEQNILRRYGSLAMNSGDLKQSIYYFLKSLKISEDQGDTFAYWGTKANIGTVYLHFKLFEEAKKNIIPSLHFYENKNSYRNSSIWAYNLSQIYSELKDYKNAEKLAHKALVFKSKIEKSWMTYKADSLYYAINLIQTIAATKPDSAIKIFKLYESWIKIEKDSSIKSLSYAYGANLVSNSNELLAKQYYDSSKLFWIETINPDIKKEIYKDYKEYFHNSGQQDSAYKYAELLTAMNDSFYSSEKLKIVANSNNLYDLLANKEIKLLKSEKQTKNAWLVGLSLGVCLLAFSVFFIYKNQKNKEKRVLAETNLNINKILEEVNQTKMEAWADGQEKERSRLAAELHDRLGGLLVMASHHFTSIEKKFNTIKKENEVAFSDFRKIINNAIIEVRELSKDISSNLVSKLGLSNAMLDLKEKIEMATGIRINLTIHDSDGKVSINSEIALFRIAQEALNNIMKHAKATEVQLSLTGNENSIILMIEDNGRGFDTNRISEFSGIGLRSMEKRMMDLGGIFNIDSKLDKGTCVIAEIPIFR